MQGLYPGYIIFFVQSALMIDGSKGTVLLAFLTFIHVCYLYLKTCFLFFFSLSSYLPLATSNASEDGNAEKCYGFHQLPLHSFGSQLLIRWFHGIYNSSLCYLSHRVNHCFSKSLIYCCCVMMFRY